MSGPPSCEMNWLGDSSVREGDTEVRSIAFGDAPPRTGDLDRQHGATARARADHAVAPPTTRK